MPEDNQIGISQAKQSGLKTLWRSLGSIRLTTTLLTVIILACILGTLIPQNARGVSYLHSYGPKLYKLLQLTDIIHLYQSWWFVGLLSLLALNLLTSVLTRISLNPNPLGWNLTRLGATIILVSVIVSTACRENGFVQIYEGEEKGTFFLMDKSGIVHPKPLEFKLRLDDFLIKHYSGDFSSAIKTYKSKVKILDKDEVVMTKTIEVNNPLRYKGYSFYQYDYDHRELRYTVLQVVKDPGVPSVYVGFVLLMLGLTLAFVVVPLTKQAKWHLGLNILASPQEGKQIGKQSLCEYDKCGIR